MASQHFTMRRDARKHLPPRPGPDPHPGPAPHRGEHRAVTDFWREDERRHTPRTVPLPPAEARHRH